MTRHREPTGATSLSPELVEAFKLNRQSLNDDKRMKEYWVYSDCGRCLRSNHNCGWCPYSATCVALPNLGHLLSPIYDKNICPMPWQERWELRTSTLGCNCSTTTFLASIITCVSTLIGLIVLIRVFNLIKYSTLAIRGTRGGWEIQEEVVEVRTNEQIWVRRKPGWGQWIKSFWQKTPDEDRLVVGEYEPLIQ